MGWGRRAGHKRSALVVVLVVVVVSVAAVTTVVTLVVAVRAVLVTPVAPVVLTVPTEPAALPAHLDSFLSFEDPGRIPAKKVRRQLDDNAVIEEPSDVNQP